MRYGYGGPMGTRERGAKPVGAGMGEILFTSGTLERYWDSTKELSCDNIYPISVVRWYVYTFTLLGPRKGFESDNAVARGSFVTSG